MSYLFFMRALVVCCFPIYLCVLPYVVFYLYSNASCAVAFQLCNFGRVEEMRKYAPILLCCATVKAPTQAMVIHDMINDSSKNAVQSLPVYFGNVLVDYGATNWLHIKAVSVFIWATGCNQLSVQNFFSRLAG